MDLGYLEEQPDIPTVTGMRGPVVVQFGTNWCGHCARAEPILSRAFEGTDVTVIKAEDGRGRPLGRHFGVKLWPTVIFLRDGEEVTRLVRPVDAGPVEEALAQIV